MTYMKAILCGLLFFANLTSFSTPNQSIEKKQLTKKNDTQKLEITGAIPGLKEGEKAFLNIWDAYKNTEVLVDSSTVKNGKFFFTYAFEEGPRLFWIKFSMHAHIIAVPLGNDKVTITSDVDINSIKSQSAFQYLRIEGSEAAKQHLYLNYAVYNCWYYSRASIDAKIKRYKDSTLNKDRFVFLSGLLSARKIMDKTIGDILKTQPVEAIIPEFFCNLPVEFQRDSSFMSIYNSLDDKIKKSYYGKLMKEQVPLCIGQPAPNCTFKASTDKEIDLQSIFLKNRITIVNLWSNHSIDRKRIHGELAEAYRKYHQKGLEVVSISFDANEGKWKKVMEEDAIPGYNFCDFKEEESPAAKLYRVDPKDTVNVLVDSTGKIIGWDIDGVMLFTNLYQVFGE